MRQRENEYRETVLLILKERVQNGRERKRQVIEEGVGVFWERKGKRGQDWMEVRYKGIVKKDEGGLKFVKVICNVTHGNLKKKKRLNP